jgi:hypothetical protein
MDLREWIDLLERECTKAGGLVSYGTSLTDLPRPIRSAVDS